MVLVLYLKFVRDRFFPGTPVSSTNKTDRHDIAEILMKALGKYHQFCIYTYFLFQNVFTSLLRSAQVSYYLLFPSKYESGFGLRDLHSLLQLPAWRMNYELCQYAIVLLLLIIPLITFKWIRICQCFRFSLSECKYFYNHS